MGWGYLSMTHSEETEYFQVTASLFTHTMHYNKGHDDYSAHFYRSLATLTEGGKAPIQLK